MIKLPPLLLRGAVSLLTEGSIYGYASYPSVPTGHLPLLKGGAF